MTEFRVGDHVRFAKDKKWWDTRAVSERFVICTRQAEFKPKGQLFYTVLDFRENVRGPINSIGNGYGDGTFSDEQCQFLLSELEAESWEVSHRNRVEIDITDHKILVN